MQQPRLTQPLGGRVVKAGVVAIHLSKDSGLEVELRWITARLKVAGAVEARNGLYASIEEVPYQGNSKHAAGGKHREVVARVFCQGTGR